MKDHTITLGKLRAILADGRLEDGMPLTIYAPNGDRLGMEAVELLTLEDGTRAISFYSGRNPVVGDRDVVSVSEVFGDL